MLVKLPAKKIKSASDSQEASKTTKSQTMNQLKKGEKISNANTHQHKDFAEDMNNEAKGKCHTPFMQEDVTGTNEGLSLIVSLN